MDKVIVMEEFKFKNDYRPFALIVFISLPILALLILILFPPITPLEISFDIITILASGYGLWSKAPKYSIIINQKYMQILSKRYELSRLKFVSLVPFIRPKNNKVYGYIIFYIQKPNTTKFKKIRIYGGLVENHHKLIDALQKYRIRYEIRRWY